MSQLAPGKCTINKLPVLRLGINYSDPGMAGTKKSKSSKSPKQEPLQLPAGTDGDWARVHPVVICKRWALQSQSQTYMGLEFFVRVY
jgi:hypothetical protein